MESFEPHFKSIRTAFDDYIVEIETGLYDIRIKLSNFVFSLLQIVENKCLELDINIPIQIDEQFYVKEVSSIGFNEKELIYLRISNTEETVLWDDLTLSAQEYIAYTLHLLFTRESYLHELT